MSSTNKLRRTLVLALAGGSLAIGVPAALAAGGGGERRRRRRAATRPGGRQERLRQDEPRSAGPRGLPRARRRRLRRRAAGQRHRAAPAI